MTSKQSLARIVLAPAVAGAAALAPMTVAGAAPSTFQYTFTNQHESDTFDDTGLCDPGPATVSLIDYNEALHVTATQAGLTEDEIEELLESENSDAITKVSYTQTGSFVVEEASDITYSGHFTNWFGGNNNPHTNVFSGVFNLSGTGDDGSQVSGHFNGHVTFVNGDEVVSFDKGTMKGCPSS